MEPTRKARLNPAGAVPEAEPGTLQLPIQFDPRPDFHSDRDDRVSRAAAAAATRLIAGRPLLFLLRLLNSVEPAAGVVDAAPFDVRAGHSVKFGCAGAPRRSDRQCGSQSWRVGDVQVSGFLRSLAGGLVGFRAVAGTQSHFPDGHLILHVSDDGVFDRPLSRRSESQQVYSGCRATRLVLPTVAGRTNHARQYVSAAIPRVSSDHGALRSTAGQRNTQAG